MPSGGTAPTTCGEPGSDVTTPPGEVSSDAGVPTDRRQIRLALGATSPRGPSDSLSRRLREHGDPHGHTVLEYRDAGHSLGYLIPQLPAGLLPPGITDEEEDRAARADAWPQAVTFIRQLGLPR